MEENLLQLIDTEFDIQASQSQRIKFTDGSSSRIGVVIKTIVSHLKSYLTKEERSIFHDLSEKQKIAIITKLTKHVAEKHRKTGFKEEMENADFSLTDLEILVELVDEDEEIYFIFDNAIKDISHIKHANLKRLVSPNHFCQIPKIPCISVYEPFATDENFNEVMIGHNTVTRVNTYRHPEWRQTEDDELLAGPASLSLPASARDFMCHLFPHKLSREYVFDWIYEALRSRQGCEHILLLNGPTGTGKTIFATQLMIALFKEENWGSAPKNLFKSAFNSVLKNKRIIFIDEAKINEQDYNTVKLYANKKLNIERKGVDANNSTDLFYSMVLSNNKMGNIYIEPDDRRFSIVETTNVKLLDLWEDKYIDDFLDQLKNVDFVRKIGNYILSRQWKNENFKLRQFKGKKFYDFVWRHLSQWQKIVCNRVFKEGKEGSIEVEVDRLKSSIKNDKHIKYDIQIDTIIEFIDTYKHNGAYKLGNIVLQDDEYVLKINSSFVKKEKINEITDLL